MKTQARATDIAIDAQRFAISLLVGDLNNNIRIQNKIKPTGYKGRSEIADDNQQFSS